MSGKRLVLAAVAGTAIGLVSWAVMAWCLATLGVPVLWASLAGGVVGSGNGWLAVHEIAEPDCELDDE